MCNDAIHEHIFQIKCESVTPVSENSYENDTAHCKSPCYRDRLNFSAIK
jgi:hypothetical protein